MFVRKELSYDLSALEPFIDAETMDEHYNVHYKNYTDKLNEVIAENNIPATNILSLMQEIRNFKKYPVAFRNNAGGYINHLVYFDTISPNNNDYESVASEDLKNCINKKFGNYESFKRQFKLASTTFFGSGWVWLASDGEKMMLLATANQDNPKMQLPNVTLLLGIDVWEHAYYLKHKADRASYIDDFFNVIDWEIVNKRHGLLR